MSTEGFDINEFGLYPKENENPFKRSEEGSDVISVIS